MLRQFKDWARNSDLVADRAPAFYLWTEHGALLHAKSLNTDKAWQTYEYLIDNYFRAKRMFEVPQSLPEALRYAAELAEQIEQQKPLVAFAETVSLSKKSFLIREFAKMCCKDGIEIGEIRMYRTLREWGLIMPGTTEPYQAYIDRGYFEVNEGTHKTNRDVQAHKITRVLPKGQIYIINRYSAHYLVDDMSAYGFHMDDVHQGENLAPVIREFEGMLKDGNILMAENNLLKAHFLNVAFKHNLETRKFRPAKIEQRARIDGFVAVIDAMTVRQKWLAEIGELLKNAR